jgi:hypothetical protein
MSAIRSSAKIANFVANGKSFERLKKQEKTVEKPKADKQEVAKKPTAREKLDKSRANEKETGRGSGSR